MNRLTVSLGEGSVRTLGASQAQRSYVVYEHAALEVVSWSFERTNCADEQRRRARETLDIRVCLRQRSTAEDIITTWVRYLRSYGLICANHHFLSQFSYFAGSMNSAICVTKRCEP